MGKLLYKIFLLLFVTEFLITTTGINFFIHNCHATQKHLIGLEDEDKCEFPHNTQTVCCSSIEKLNEESYHSAPAFNCCSDSHDYLKIIFWYVNSENVYILNLFKNILVSINCSYQQEIISGLPLISFSKKCFAPVIEKKIILQICKLTI